MHIPLTSPSPHPPLSLLCSCSSRPASAQSPQLSDDGTFYCSMPDSNLAVSYCGGDYPSRTNASLGVPDDKLYAMLDTKALAATMMLVRSYGCNEEQCKGMICAAVFPVCDLSSKYTFPVCAFTCKECAATCRDKQLPNVVLDGGVSVAAIVKNDTSCGNLPDSLAFACSSDASVLRQQPGMVMVMVMVMVMTAMMLLA